MKIDNLHSFCAIFSIRYNILRYKLKWNAEEEEDGSAGNIIVLSSAWLTPKKCEAYWPICKLTYQFNKLLQRHEPPSEDWQLIKIKRKFFETDNLILARSKAKEAEYNSDLTDVGEQTTSKRTVKPTKRYIVSSDDEDVNEDIFSHQKLKHKKKLKEIFENSVPAKSPIVSVAGSPVIVDSPKSSNIVDECDNIYVGDILKQQEKNTLKSPVTSSYIPLISESPCNSEIAVPINVSAYEYNSMKLLSTIVEQNNQILTWIRSQKNTESLKSKRCIQLPISFPLENEEDLHQLEVFINDDNNFIELCEYFNAFGSHTSTSTVNKILKHCLTNKLAMKFSYRGKKGKQAFEKLNLRAAVIRSVKKSFQLQEDRTVEDDIKIWLKHAPQRSSLEEKKVLSKLERWNKSKN